MEWRQDKSGTILPSRLYEKPRIVRFYDRDRDRDRDGGSAHRAGLAGGGGGGGGGAELAALDFAEVAPINPYMGSAAWPLSRNFVSMSKATGSRWESNPTNCQVSMVAAEATIDMTGEPKVYVSGTKMLSAGTKATALMLSNKYDNGPFWDADGGGDPGLMVGYLLILTKFSLQVYAYRGVGGENAYASNNFGNPLGSADGELAKVEMRVTLGSPNVIQVLVDDTPLGADWEDAHVDRAPAIKTCGASLVGGADIVAMTRISVGTFT